MPSGEITGSGLIHKTHRTLESLLQFELSNHNGKMRLPFFAGCMCVFVRECVHGRLLRRFIFPGPVGLG